MDVTAIVIGIVIGDLIMSYKTITQDTCPHDSKVKMPGLKDRYECTRCHKFIPYVPLDKKMVIA